jgi:methionyl aminopeptidase
MIVLKEPWELGVMRNAGRRLAEVVARLREVVAEGMETRDLDRLTEEAILSVGARPAFKGYAPEKTPFPASLCVSINEQVVHGVPGRRRLEPGDVVSLDFGLVYGGYYADTAFTVVLPPVADADRMLVEATEAAMHEGIARARVGGRVGDIGHAVETYCRARQLGVVRKFVGHGIGKRLHEEPSVPNFGKAGTGPLLKAGLVLAIEPMITLGGEDTKILPDRWTVVTKDNSRSAHFEHTVAITPSGPEILTVLDVPAAQGPRA